MWRLLTLCAFFGAAGLGLARDLGWNDRAFFAAMKGGAENHSGSTSPPPSKKGGGAAPVTAAIAVEQDMPVLLGSPGTVEPLASVAIRSRVDGQIVEVGFKEGDLVTAGQVLFKLDDRLVLSQIRAADAAISRDQASLKDAEATLERREQLVSKKIVSEASTDTARASVEVLKASIVAGKAALEMQKTQLDYLTIRAPITGRTGSVATKLGSNVRAADLVPLLTINQTRPIAVTFAIPQSELGTLRRALASGAKAEITVPGRKDAKLEGSMSMIDNQVDKQTGTLTAKVIVDNADEILWPGQAVDVSLIVEVRKNIVSVPASAVLPSQRGMVVWVVGSDNRVALREVTLDRTNGQTAYITQGMKAGERVVTDGQIRLAPNASVIVHDGSAPPAAAATGIATDKAKRDGKDIKVEDKGRRS